jgi:hypothetical protein
MRTFVLVFGTFLQLAASVSGARADQIFLEGGRVLEGEATVDGDKVEVVLESGRISFPRSEVLRVDKSTSPLAEARTREAALDSRDVAGALRLADFCREHQLLNKERELLERIIALEPDHAEARHRLGYVREGKLWIDRDELARRAELARSRDRQDRLTIAQKRTDLELAQAKLESERMAAQRSAAQLENELNERRNAQAYGRYGSYGSYAAYGGAYGWYGSPLLYAGPRPPLSAPSGPPAFAIPGVRHPSDMSFNINGARSPASYFDGAFRR